MTDTPLNYQNRLHMYNDYLIECAYSAAQNRIYILFKKGLKTVI